MRARIDRRGLVLGAAAAAASPTSGEEIFETLTTFTSGDATLHAIEVGKRDLSPKAGVVLLHGAGGLPLGYEGLRAAGRRLAAEGYAALIPNYFEAGADDGIRRPRLMARWRSAARDAVHVMADRGLDVGLWGVSLGGYVAVDTAVGQSCEASSAVGVVTGSDVYVPRSPVRRPSVLMIYGARDSHVRPQSTLAWAELLRDAGVPTTVRRVDDAGHIFSQDQWRRMLDMTVTHFSETLA